MFFLRLRFKVNQAQTPVELLCRLRANVDKENEHTARLILSLKKISASVTVLKHLS